MKQSNLLVIVIINFIFIVVAGYYKMNNKNEGVVQQPPPQQPPIFQPQPPVQPPTQPEPEPPQRQIKPNMIDVEKVSDRVREDSIYADIINHSRNPVLSHDRDTNAHETTHMINSDIRNSQGARKNGFYIPGGKGVVVDEPKFRKRDCIPFLPQSIRSYRYNLYIQGQTDWDDMPTYIFDEWVAYVNGAAVSVEDVENNKHDGQWTDAVSGCLGFSIYAVSIAMACEKNDPNYWNSNQQFKDFIYWHLKRSHEVFEKGHTMQQFKWDKQEKLYANFLNDSAAAPMREFIRKHFDGTWLDGPMAEKFKRQGVQANLYDWQLNGKNKVVRINDTEIGIQGYRLPQR